MTATSVQTFTVERTIGTTTYIVKSCFSANSKDDAISRIVKVVGKKIKQDMKIPCVY